MSNIYTNDLSVVVTKEKEYLGKRRETNGIASNAPITGLCISGGGIRSATLGLGMMQALMKAGKFKRFDYMSTVSGGGYIGACLSSLLSHRSIPDQTDGTTEIGVNPENSPFVGLREKEALTGTHTVSLSVRHQLHHLRSRGDYLTPIKRLLSRDVQRAVGTVAIGMAHNLTLLFLAIVAVAALLHALCYGTMGNNFTALIGYCRHIPFSPEDGIAGTLSYLSDWVSVIVSRTYFDLMTVAALEENWFHATMFFFGAVWVLLWILSALLVRSMAQRATKMQFVTERIEAGKTVQDHLEGFFIGGFNGLSVIMATVFSLFFGLKYGAFSFFFLPTSFGLGGWVGCLILVPIIEFFDAKDSSTRRSLFGAIRGACVYGFLLSLIIPLIVILGFAVSNIDHLVWTTLVSLAITYGVTHLKNSPEKSRTSTIVSRIKVPLMNLAVGVFVLILFSWTSRVLFRFAYPLFLSGYDACQILLGPWAYTGTGQFYFATFSADPTLSVYVGVGVFAALVLVILGIVIDSNHVSPHYFYRDRLADTYLKTNARVLRSARCTGQGFPMVEIRNDENLKLTELGGNNGSGPYHLIIGAINLQGSDELNRKTMLSDHFLFSKYYVGSEVTGYARTDCYRGGNTKLGRAMTISGAAASSAMGKGWFFAQSFAMTLFNVRLGYWMANPLLYCRLDEEQAKRKHGDGWITFWPWYLWLELRGGCTAKGRLVNLSDGGHTGDNLALLPLLQRRCTLIVVCDFEQDPSYEFDSFNNAVRMAYVEENVEIRIDLREIVPESEDGVRQLSRASVAKGDILYPETADHASFKGTLIYIKSSLSETEAGGKLPVHVLNYSTSAEEFPHQSTVDQFFDDAQFEAYRALGFHLGNQAVPLVKDILESNATPQSKGDRI